MAVALVTGASSGIGLATAVTLARGGHAVIAMICNAGLQGMGMEDRVRLVPCRAPARDGTQLPVESRCTQMKAKRR